MRTLVKAKLLVFLLLTIAVLILFPPKMFLYDYSHKNYDEYLEIISEHQIWETIDFSDFENGEWRVLCVFGGYTYPAIYMEKLADINNYYYFKQRIKSYSIFRLGEVEEFETAIAYIDLNNSVRFMQIDASPPFTTEFSLEHRIACIDRAEPILKFTDD